MNKAQSRRLSELPAQKDSRLVLLPSEILDELSELDALTKQQDKQEANSLLIKAWYWAERQGTLTDQQLRIFKLTFGPEALSLEVIANRLSLSRDTVKEHLNKALARIKAKANPEAKDKKIRKLKADKPNRSPYINSGA